MRSSPVSQVPVLWLLVPFTAGILASEWLKLYAAAWPVAMGGVMALLAMVLPRVLKSPLARLNHRHLLTIPVAGLLFSLGWLDNAMQQPKAIVLSRIEGKVLSGTISDLTFKDFSMQLHIDVQAASDSAKTTPAKFKLNLSTRGCNYALRPGDLVAFPAQVSRITNRGNPDELDIATLMRRQGIIYESHIDVQSLTRYGHSTTLKTWFACQRIAVQRRILDSSLSPPAAHFVIALFLGNDDFLDNETRTAFSQAGVAHILALSGLHVGVIAFCLWLLLFPLDYLQLRQLRMVLTLLLLVAFDLFTGLPPSVLRATVMIGFAFIPMVFHRQSHPLNSLGVAALLILLITPQAIFGVGFQLSFLSVAALLILTPRPTRQDWDKSWLRRHFTTLLTTSLIALVATSMLSTYYFHTLSLSAVISNLLILPLFPVFMVMGALFVVLSCMGLEIGVLNLGIDGLYQLFTAIVNLINTLPRAHIDQVSVTGVEVALFYAFLTLAVIAYKTRNKSMILPAGCLLAAMMAVNAHAHLSTSRAGLVVFNTYQGTPVVCFEQGHAVVWCPDNEEFDPKEFQQYNAAFFAHHSIDSLRVIKGDETARWNGGFIKPPFVSAFGVNLMFIGPGKWKQMQRQPVTGLHYLVLTKRFHGSVAVVDSLFRPRHILLSGALYQTDYELLRHQCDSAHLSCFDMRRQGALTKWQ